MHRTGWLVPLTVVFLCVGLLGTYQHSYQNGVLATSTTYPQYPWDKEALDIQKISFSSKDYILTAQRDTHSWFIVDPIQTSGDASFIYEIITTFITPEIADVVSTTIQPSELGDYGITATSPTLTLYDKEGASYSLVQGKSYNSLYDYAYSPTTGSIYTLSHTLFDLIPSSIEAWYDKDYIDFNPETIQYIEVSYKDYLHTITVTPGDLDPIYTSSTLDEVTVLEIVRFLKTSRLNQLITTNSSDTFYKTYGFNDDILSIKLFQSAEQFFEIQINVDMPSDLGYYVYLPKQSTLLTIPIFNINFSLNQLTPTP